MPTPPDDRDPNQPFLEAFPHPHWGGDDGTIPVPTQWDRLRGWWEEHWPLKNHASRCPPLTLANQFGWVLPCPFSFTATWNGESAPASMVLTPTEPDPRFPVLVTNHVGGGCFSINTGQLFRSSPDVILYVKGVANVFKPGAHCVDALVETDWLLGGFALVFKLTHPGQTVEFKRGEPLAQIVPMPRGFVESLRTGWVNTGPAYEKRMHEFALFDYRREQASVNRDYARGLDARGVRYPEHQNGTRQGSFERGEMPPPDRRHRWPTQLEFWDTFLDADDRAAVDARQVKDGSSRIATKGAED